MNNTVEAITTASLSMALDAAALRHQLISSNIANSQVEGYVPLYLRLDEELEGLRRDLQTFKRLDIFGLTAVRMQVEPAFANDGRPEKVQLDAEVASLSANAVLFQALTKGLQKHFSLLSLAVGDGKK